MIPAESIALETSARPVRFLWRTDRDGRFHIEPGEFLTLAGAQTATLVGQAWPDVAARLGVDADGAVREALAAGTTWSGLDLDWPVGTSKAHVQLSGFPVFGDDGTLTGYRGFGLCDPSASSSLSHRALRPDAANAGNEADRPNVVPFRGSDRRAALTPVEQNAFQEIARTLEAFAGELQVPPASHANASEASEPVPAPRLENELHTQPAPQLPELRTRVDRPVPAAERSREPENLAGILASLADTLRTPLHTIIGLSQLVLEAAGPDGEPSRRYLSDIRQAGQEVLSALNGLLEIAQARSGALRSQPTFTQVNPVIADCVAAVHARAAAGRVLVRLSLGSDVSAAAIEENALRHLATNLLSGVVQTTSAGGQIIVSTANAKDLRPVLRVRRSEPTAREGSVPQAPADARAASSEAAALALSLARALAEASGARLKVMQQANGAFFELTLPLARTAAP